MSIERFFVAVSDGQIHARRAGWHHRGIPLLCLHHSPSSSRLLEPLVILGSVRRPVVALDTPGYGESFQPTNRPSLEEYAQWIADAIDRLGLERVHVFGYHTGSCIALELARRRPDRVSRLVLCGIPLFDEQRRAAYRQSPWPSRVDEEGQVLASDWQLVRAAGMAGLSLEERVIAFYEMRRSGQFASWGVQAVCEYDLPEALRTCRHPVLAIRCGHDLWAETARAAELLPAARLLERPEWSHGVFQVRGAAVANAVEEFLEAART